MDEEKGSTNAAETGSGSRLGNVASSIRQFTKKNKKPLLGGGISAGIAGLLFASFFALLPLKLLHIAENLFHHNFGRQESFEKKEGRKVLKSLLKVANQAENGKKVSTGHLLRDKLANAKIEKFKASLSEKGIEMEFKNGKLISIKTPEGDLVNKDSSFFEKRSAVLDLVDSEIPHWRVGKLITYRRLMTFHSGVSFRFWPADKAAKTKEILKEKVRGGASAEEITAADELAHSADTPPANDPKDPKGSTQKQTDFETAKAKSSSLRSSLKTVKDTFASSGSASDAISAGVAEFRISTLKNTLTLTGIASMLCTVETLAVDSVKSSAIAKTQLAIRHGNVILTAVSQMKEGKVTGEQYNDLMHVFDGSAGSKLNQDNTLKTVKNAPPPEETKSFDQSAAWKRATNEPVTSANPELQSSANPNPNAFSQVVSGIDSVMNATGLKFTCSILTSPIGILAQLAGAVAQIVGDIGSFGTAEAATIAGGVAAQTAIIHYLPDVLAEATGLGITGTEDAVQFLNISDAGLNLSASDYARRLGGRALSNAEVASLDAQVHQEDIAMAKEKGLGYQLFATENPDSIFSKFLNTMPTTPQTAIASIYSNLKAMPTNFAGIFFPSNFAHAGNTTSDVNPYNFKQYGYTDAETSKYDVLENEDVMQQSINIGDQTITLADGLGDPTSYVDTAAGDTNTWDLLHCFVNTYTNQDDSVCGSMLSLINDGVTQKDPDLKSIICNYQGKSHANCNPALPADLFLRYRQYILDSHIANDYVSITSDDAGGQ